MGIFYPCALLIRSIGLQKVMWFLSLLFAGLIGSLLYFDISLTLMISVSLFYMLIGTAWLANTQLAQIKDVLHKVDITHFDHRNIHFGGSVDPEFIEELLKTYRELGRINNQYQDRNKEVEYSALQVIDISSKVRSNVASQADATNSTASAITEMSQSLVEVNHQISETHNSSCQASEKARDGKHSLTSLHKSVNEVSQQAQSTQQRMVKLNTLVTNVEKITESIKQISQQTNLLALNASIEAARAGEFGRGFAVVAEEVRALAERTQSSTETIVENINEVLTQSSDIVATMGQMVDYSEQCSQCLDEVEAAFNNIEVATDQVKQQMETVSTVATQQAIATNEISEHIEKVVVGAQSNSEIATQTELVANHLRKLTQVA